MTSSPSISAQAFNRRVGRTAFAFRGYNTTNLGRTHELWEVDAYRPVIEKWLAKGNAICHEEYGQSADLVGRVVGQLEAGLAHYAEAVAFIMAVEFAQIELLELVHGVSYCDAKLSFGYSLGELAAVASSGLISHSDAMTVPVALASDAATLAHEVVMGILFSRSEVIDEQKVNHLCESITSEQQGVIGVSAVLSPNTYLVLGQHETISRFKYRMHEELPKSAHLKVDRNPWPPLHTPIVRQRHIPDRASVMMERMTPLDGPERPRLFSLATGAPSYDAMPLREILRQWVDRPQRLWDAVQFTLREDVDLVVHVGPAPNVIPATFHRLSDNVSDQLARLSLASAGIRAVSNLIHRRWLANLLPNRATLLRAPNIEHIVLEDWLIEHAPR